MDKTKVSFGFSKIIKKTNLLLNSTKKEEKQVELIKCLEGKEIQLVQEKTDAAPLVIPMQQSTKTSSALASLMKRRAVLLGEEEEENTARESERCSVINNSNENSVKDIEERAVSEILAAAKATGKNTENDTKLVLAVPKPDELTLDGAKEPTQNDYEDIPVEQFGLAMLRGMGWVEPPKKKSGPIDDGPLLRPKGMGLGADKALKTKPLLIPPEANEKLEIKKQAFVRILAGKHKDAYGQIEGFDDEHCRVIIKMAIGGNKETFNEFLCQPVSKKEFAEYGKCINTVKYEEYKRMENEYGQIVINKQDNENEKEYKHRTKEYKVEKDEKHRDMDKQHYKMDKEDKYRREYKMEKYERHRDIDKKYYKMYKEDKYRTEYKMEKEEGRYREKDRNDEESGSREKSHKTKKHHKYDKEERRSKEKTKRKKEHKKKKSHRNYS